LAFGVKGRTAYWVTVSSFLRNYAWRVLGVPVNRTELLPNGVEVPEELPPWCPKPVIGIVARLVPSKGVDVFLRGIQLLRPEVPDLRAVVIGDGPAKLQLQALSRELGLTSVVSFLGHCDDVSSQLNKIAVFVLPTRSEGLGISVMEAMSQGVPVVVTAVGGVPELVQHNITGLLIRPDDYGSIARYVRQILGDRDKAEIMRRAAYSYMSSNYSLNTMLKGTHGLYRRVLDG